MGDTHWSKKYQQTILHPKILRDLPMHNLGSEHALNLHDFHRFFGGRVSANRRIYRGQRL